MRKTISFLVGLLMGIILTVGSIIGIPLYLLNSKSLSDVEDMTGADLGLFEDQEDVDGVMDMSILSLIGYTAGLLEGDENGKLTLEDLSTKLGFSSQLPTEFQQLYTLDLKSMSENPDQVSEIIMDSITVDMIMSMSKLDANDGSFGSMLAGISDMSLSSVLGGVDNLPIGIIAGITPNEYYAEDSLIVTYYKNHIGYTTPVVSEQPDDLNDLLRKLLFKADDNGEYIAYIQPTGDGAYAYLKYEMLHVTNDTARYDLVDGEYKLLKSPDLTDANLYVKVRGNYLSVEDATALYVLYASAPRYNAADISAMSDMQSVVGDLTLGDLASLMGLEQMALLESLMGYTIDELGSNPDVFEDIEIATLLGDEIADTMLSNILLKKMTTTPSVGDKVWVDRAGVKTYIQLTSDDIYDYSEYYRAITVSELTDEDMSNMTLATFMPDVTDDILLKVLYREVESDHEYSEGEIVYYRDDDGKMIEIVYQDSAIPSGETIYKALTINELTSGGIDINSIVQEIELAPLMGESGVSDSLFIEIIFDRVDNRTLSVDDEVYRLESGVMKPYVIKDNGDLAETNKYFKSKTVSQLMNMQLENLEIVKFVSNSADDLIVAILYDKVDTSTLTNGDTVYYKSGGVMVEAEYTSSMRDMSLYKGVSIKDFGEVDITERVKGIALAQFLMSGDTLTDETLVDIVFSEMTDSEYLALGVYDTVYYKGEEGMYETTKGELDAINSTESEDSRYTAYKSMTLLDFASLDMSAKVKEIEIARYLADPEDKVSGDLIVKMLFRQVDSEYLSSLGKYDKVYIKSEGAMIRVSKEEVDSQTVYRSLTMSELSSIDIKSIVDDMQLIDLLDIKPDTMLAKIFMAEYSDELVAGDYYYVEDGKYVKYTYPSGTTLSEGTALYVALSASDMSNKMENLLIIDIVDVEPNTLMSALAYEELEGNMVEGTTYYYIQGDEYLVYTGTTLPQHPLYRPRAVKESAAASENLLVRDVINVKPDSLMSNVAYAEVDVLEPGHTYYYRQGDEYAHFNYTGKENTRVEDCSTPGPMYKAEKMKDMPDRMANLTLTDVLGEPKRREFYDGDEKKSYCTGIWAIFEKEEDGKTTIDDIKLANLDKEISDRIKNITLGTMERLQGEEIEGLDGEDRKKSVKELIETYAKNKDIINNLS